MKINSSFSSRLELALEESGMTQKELSERTGISKSLLNKYIKGVSETNNIKLNKLAQELKVSPLWLMGYDVSRIYKEETTNDENKELKDLIINKIEKLDRKSLEQINKIIDAFTT